MGADFSFEKYHPPTERAFVVKRFRDPNIVPLVAVIYVKRRAEGTWIPFAYLLGPYEGHYFGPEHKDFWSEFMMWEHDPVEWALEFPTKKDAIEWISRRLKSFGFKPW